MTSNLNTSRNRWATSRSRGTVLASLFFSFAFSAYGQVSLPSGDSDKLLAQRPIPTYPPLARAARIEGKVVVEVVVSDKGSVTSARVVSGNALLTEEAINVAKKYRYQPYVVAGVPTVFRTRIEVSFSLAPQPAKSDEQKQREQQYLSLRRECQDRLQKKDWKQATSKCQALSEARESEGFNWMIYGWIGTAHLGQQHFEDALTYFNRALELTPVKTATGVELAYAYRGVAMANHSLQNITLAREFYVKAETRLQDAEQVTGNQIMRQEFEKVLQATRQLHQLLERNAVPAEVERELAKQLGLGLW